MTVLGGLPTAESSVPCSRCGEPIPVLGIFEVGVEAASLDLSGSAVAHVVCPSDRPAPAPERHYEVRVAVYAHEGEPPDEWGRGGEKLVHTRAVVAAPSFVQAFEALSAGLSERWAKIQENAEMVDLNPGQPE